MATKQQVGQYCEMHGLGHYERPLLDARFGPSEFEGVQSAGFFHPLGMGGMPPMIVLMDDGTVEAFVAGADGERFMEDKFTVVKDDELAQALRTGVKLHSDP